jgi:hypothetical protein
MFVAVARCSLHQSSFKNGCGASEYELNLANNFLEKLLNSITEFLG